jgi:hypothetical protein
LTAVIASQTGSNVMRSVPELEPQVEDEEADEASESDEADEQAEPTGN